MPNKPKPKPRPRPRPKAGYGGIRAAWVADDEWIEDPVMPSTMTIIEDEDDFTGLYDAQGNPLYRAKAPMGFQVSEAASSAARKIIRDPSRSKSAMVASGLHLTQRRK